MNVWTVPLRGHLMATTSPIGIVAINSLHPDRVAQMQAVCAFFIKRMA